MLWKWRIVAPGSLGGRVEEKRISFARSEFNYLKLPFVYYLSLATTAKTTLESATLTMDSSQDHACLPPEAMFSPSTTQRGGFARPSPLLGYYIFFTVPLVMISQRGTIRKPGHGRGKLESKRGGKARHEICLLYKTEVKKVKECLIPYTNLIAVTWLLGGGWNWCTRDECMVASKKVNACIFYSAAEER